MGAALTAQSEVWFTLSHGILNEIYYPRIDHACTRDCGFMGIHFADLDTAALQSGAEVIFTFYWPAADRWEGVDWRVAIL